MQNFPLYVLCQGVITNFVSKILKFGKGPSINVIIPLSINLLKKSTLVQGAEKLCSKSGEDRSMNDVTISSTDAGHWRPETGVKWFVILSNAMHCIEQTKISQSFLVGDSIYAIARYMPSPIRPSVCLSITRVDQSKTVEVRITQPSPQSSPMTLVSWRLTSPCNSKGKIGSGGVE